MLTMTIEQATGDNPPDETGYYLYLVRDGDTVFYVGQSVEPYERLSNHIGLALLYEGTGSDSLGSMIGDNYPDSLAWIFELYTLQDCEPFIEHHATSREQAAFQKALRKIEAETIDRFGLKCAMDDAEDALIEHFRPCLNRARVHFDSLIPMRYLKKQLERNRAIRREYRKREYP